MRYRTGRSESCTENTGSSVLASSSNPTFRMPPRRGASSARVGQAAIAPRVASAPRRLIVPTMVFPRLRLRMTGRLDILAQRTAPIFPAENTALLQFRHHAATELLEHARKHRG